MLAGKRILLIIGGGIAAYKSLDLIRQIGRAGGTVVPVLTRAAEEFVTPLSASALAAQKVYRDLFDLTDEAEMGHIELSRAADLVVVAGPDEGQMACGEFGPGRMAEADEILAQIAAALRDGPLTGKHVLVTSGPTHEPIDPVRYIANRSSGAQGAAVAGALRDLGAKVSFVTGPASVPPPSGVSVYPVETAKEMLAAVRRALPADAAVFAAAVADWRVDNAARTKMKKDATGTAPALVFAENPDILATVSKAKKRPKLVVGFAAETNDVLDHATAKRVRKGCDWIVANDVSPESGVMGGTENAVTLITDDGAEVWPRMGKDAVAQKLAARIAEALV